MLRNLVTGLPVMFLCLVLQAGFVTTLLHYYSGHGLAEKARGSQLREILVLSLVMLLMLLSNLAQMAIWAVLFLLLGEFEDAMILKTVDEVDIAFRSNKREQLN